MSKRKLLLADDSMTIQKVVNLTFADEGIEVFTVGNGSLAIERLSEIEPDLVLADVHMPGLNGYQVCEQIRQNPQFQNVPVMLLVGSFEPFDEQEAQRVGANDFLTKPFQSIRQLVQKVTALLANHNNEINEGAESETQVMLADAEQTLVSNDSFDAQNFYVETPIEAPITASTDAAPQSLEMNFSDSAFDDEMIETSSGSNFGANALAATSAAQIDEQNFAKESPVETIEQSQALRTKQDNNLIATETPLEMRQTEPLSFDDIQDINSSMRAPQVKTRAEEVEIFELEPSEQIESTSSSAADFAQELPENNFSQNAFDANANFDSNDDFDVELDVPASSEQSFEVSDFEIISDEETYQTENLAPSKSFNFAAESYASASANEFNEPLELDLDEANLLQIDDDDDSILDLHAEEVGSDLQLTEIETLPMMPREIVQQNLSESANTALTQVGNRAIARMNLDFPPEVIEAIAQLVVEKLSDKVIEKIAWEIVPDRFDLIVRKQMDRRDR